MILLFTTLYTKVTKKNVSLSTLTYLYTVGVTSSWLLSNYSPLEFGDIVASRYTTSDWSTAYVSWFMAPPSNIANQLVKGHVAIPWGDWLPSILYHWILLVLVGFFLISVATLFRRQWLDVDRVPFPHTLVNYELVRRFPEERPLMQKLGRPFLLGIILGIAFQVPVFMITLFPWFPDIYGWRTLCGTGAWYVKAGTPLAGIVGLSTIQMNPVVAAVAYLAPLSISFNVWFWYLVYAILMQIAYSMGYYTGIESYSGCGRAWCSPCGQYDPPYKFLVVSNSGGIIGLTLVSLILSRKYIRETLRAAFAKHSSRLEIEKNEALTYRNTYILMASSFVLLFILFMLIGIGFLAVLLLLIGYFLFWFAYARLYGLSGIQPGSDNVGGSLHRIFMWPTAPDPPTREYVLAAYYSRRADGTPNSVGGSGMLTGFSCYKMASLTGTSNSNVLKVMLTGTVITPLVVIITFISFCYAFGGSSSANGSTLVGITQFFNYSNPTSFYNAPGKDPIAPYVIAGIIIVFVLEFLHARFIWFPFNAMGFIIGTTWASTLMGYWMPFLIAWVLKTISLRIGGSKLYENVGFPIAAGFIVGYVIALLIGGAVGISMFFKPY